jgi:hypothetical protein
MKASKTIIKKYSSYFFLISFLNIGERITDFFFNIDDVTKVQVARELGYLVFGFFG